jgi:TolB protein
MTVEEPGGSTERTSVESDPNPEPAGRWPRGRPRLLTGLTPTSILLPLAVLALLIYFFAVGPSRQIESSTEDLADPTPSPVMPTPSPSRPPAIATPAEANPAPENLQEQLEQAWTLVERSEFEDAIAIYRELSSDAPDDPRPEIDWAWALILDSQADQALAHAYRSVELDPTNAQTMAVLARAYVDIGDERRALGMAQNAVQLDARSALAHAVLAEAYWLNGSDQEAVEEAGLALAQDEDNAEAHRIRGWLYATVEGDLPRAILEFERATELQPRLWLRHYELGLILLSSEDYRQAMAALTQALDLRPQPSAYTALGEVYYRLGQLGSARAALLEALSAGVRLADTFALLAIVDAQEGKCSDAKLYFEQALSREPNHPLAQEARELCLQSAAVPAPTPTSPSTPSPTQPPPSLTGRIAFPVWNVETGQYDTYIANADGSARQLVVKEMHQPALRPDGQWLAVNGEARDHMNLFVVRPDGTDLREISQHIEDGLPSWSPAGESLVFGSTRHQDRQSRLYILDQVPWDGAQQVGRLLNSDLYELLGDGPTWTIDDRIVYQGCDYTATPAQCGLYSIPAAPGPQVPLPLTDHPEDSAPAAHAGRIAFMSNRDGNWEVYVVNGDGSGLMRLTRNPANDGLPTWSPDGSYLAFASDRGGRWAVWATTPDGSLLRELFDLGEGGLASDWQRERISWGP